MTSQLFTLLSNCRKVLIVGSYPPPLGGVSVHIYRLHKMFKNTEIFDLSQKSNFKGQSILKLSERLLKNDFDAVHLHSYTLRFALLLLIMRILKGFKIIVTIHNARLFEKTTRIKKYILRKSFNKIDALVLVGPHILESYKQQNIKLPETVIIEPAFLPPPLSEEDKILQTYPDELFTFIENHKPLITANAFQVVFYEDSDLYGLDMCIELTAKLKDDFPNVGFIFALANEHEKTEYLEEIRQRIKALGIENNFYFLTGQKELWPLFRKVNLMIRPTMTDGDALSIREAMYFGCPAVASDVCVRPEGTIVFKSRDIDDYTSKVKAVLESFRHVKIC